MELYKNSVNKAKIELNSNEYEMLRYISKREYRTYKEVTDYLNVDKSLVTRMGKKLIKLGYLIETIDKVDSRKKLLRVTDKSKNLKLDIVNEEYDFYNALIKVLTKEELNNLEVIIDKLYIESKRLRKSNFKGVTNEEL